MQTPAWKPAFGFSELYEVSESGDVRHKKFNRALAKCNDKDGYLFVRLCKGGKVSNIRLGRLVLLSFVGEPAFKAEALHKNHDKKDNRLTNLEWGTRLENERQKTAAGRRPRTTKLTSEQVANIKQMRAEGATLKAIGAQFNTHYTNISLICRGVTWA
jgi:hypothetical protein